MMSAIPQIIKRFVWVGARFLWISVAEEMRRLVIRPFADADAGVPLAAPSAARESVCSPELMS